jgi:hypothetical protein
MAVHQTRRTVLGDRSARALANREFLASKAVELLRSLGAIKVYQQAAVRDARCAERSSVTRKNAGRGNTRMIRASVGQRMLFLHDGQMSMVVALPQEYSTNKA